MTIIYESVIGLEIHVELTTKSKLFCNCSTSVNRNPNTQVCPVCLGLPGSLPVMNKKALEYGIRTSVALNCDITKNIQFERKNYYYPDLPKNYQISQLRRNLGTNGWIKIRVNGKNKVIGIDNIHLEEDAGKSLHRDDSILSYSLVDLNRAGTPLIEIVTKPDMRSSDEVFQFMNDLKLILEYIGVSDCNMHEGRLRFEANISVREQGNEVFGTKVEIKNLNSMKFVTASIDYEINRQTNLLRENKRVAQETRLWDENKRTTRAMRSKEEAHDYRYFPDPDLTEIEVTDTQIEMIKADFPELPEQRKFRFFEAYNLPEYDIEVLISDKYLSEYFESVVKLNNNPKLISNWVLTEILRYVKDKGYTIEDFPVKPYQLAELIEMIDEEIITGSIAKDVLKSVLEGEGEPREIVDNQNLSQITNSTVLAEVVDDIISQNTEVFNDLRNGKNKVLGYLIGQVMKATKGKANPKIVNELFKRRTNE